MKFHLAKKPSYLIGGVVLLLLCLGLVFWLTEAENFSAPAQDSKITIVTTVFPLTDIVQNIAGEEVKVVQLLPVGASPHTYTLAPNQLVALQQAQAVFFIGHGLDNWVLPSRILDTNAVQVDQNINLRHFGSDHQHNEHEEQENEPEAEAIDPHYWLTVPNAKTIAVNIAQAIQEVDPINAETYQANLTTYLQRLDSLENELKDLVAGAENKEFIAIHDAWSYLADHYGLTLLTTYEPVEGREPSLADIAELQDLIATHNITTFFTEPQKQSTGATRFLQDELGLEIEILDPLGGEGERDSYINLMRANLEAIVD